MGATSILEMFPKKRMELPDAYKKIYREHYVNNREGKYKTTSLSQKLEAWMHRKVAADVLQNKLRLTTLEIGAGTLNQLQYENGTNQDYDIVEPFTALFQNSPLLKRIRTVYSDIIDVPSTQKYDRITSIATFEHIMDLPFIIAKAALLLKENGHMRVAIPNEGTILWKLGTKVTGFEFKRKYRLDYQTLMKYEHVNTADDIEKVLDCFFTKTKCSVFGISKKFAFYRYYDCSIPELEKVKKYLASK